MYLALRSLTPFVQKGKIRLPERGEIPRILMNQLLEEWGLKGKRFRFSDIQLTCNPNDMITIFSDWHQRHAHLYYKGDFYVDMKESFKKINQISKRKQAKWSKKDFYAVCLQREYLTTLNQEFRTEGVGEVGCQGIDIEEAFPLSLEMRLDRELHHHLKFGSHFEQLTEFELESFLYDNLDLIEPGLRPMSRQQVLPNGRIDIMGKDKDGNIVIVEAKVTSDSDLVWQSQYYVKEMEKLYGEGRVRFIAIVPKFVPHIMNEVLEKSNCSVIVFKGKMKGKRLQELNLKIVPKRSALFA